MASDRHWKQHRGLRLDLSYNVYLKQTQFHRRLRGLSKFRSKFRPRYARTHLQYLLHNQLRRYLAKQYQLRRYLAKQYRHRQYWYMRYQRKQYQRRQYHQYRCL